MKYIIIPAKNDLLISNKNTNPNQTIDFPFHLSDVVVVVEYMTKVEMKKVAPQIFECACTVVILPAYRSPKKLLQRINNCWDLWRGIMPM
jgi:hypothetical protein